MVKVFEGNTIAVLALVIGTVIGVVGTIAVLIPLAKNKGLRMGQYLSVASDTITKANSVFDTIKPFLPAAPAVNTIDKILDWAAVGVSKAEQLYHIGEIQGDQRKKEAEDYIYNILKMAGIEITPEIQKVVDGAIEASVLALGHKITEAIPEETRSATE